MPTVEDLLNAEDGPKEDTKEPDKGPEVKPEETSEGTGDAKPETSEEPEAETKQSAEEEAAASEEAPEVVPPTTENEPTIEDLKAQLDESKKALAGKTKAQEAERNKRQEIEKKLADQAAQQQRPDQFDDPEGARQFDEAKLEDRLFNEKANMSEVMIRQGPDAGFVDEALQMFSQAAENSPALSLEMRQSHHPYQFIVTWARKEQTLKEIGDPKEWEAKTRAEIEAKFKADVEALSKANQETAKREALPESLAGETSAATGRDVKAPDSVSVEQLLDD